MNKPLFFLVLACFPMVACSSRVFYITANPEGSLIRHQEYIDYSNLGESGKEEIPCKIMFAGKKARSGFVAMKRGYYEDTILVTRESSPKISFDLRKIEGAEYFPDYESQLSGADLIIMPPQIDVILHKGVGNLSKYEKSDALSEDVSKNILTLLQNQTKNRTGSVQIIISSMTSPKDTLKVPREVMEYLFSVKTSILKYYGIPPSIKRFSGFWKDLSGLTIPSVNEITNPFGVIVYCKTIKPTAGRIIGNIAATVASGAVSGYQIATSGTSAINYNPESFSFDSSTLLTIYLIHPGSGEIVKIIQKSLPYEIIDTENQEKIVTELIEMICSS